MAIQKQRPETIENRWDMLYRDYPEVYEEFSSVPYSKSWIDVARKLFGFQDQVIADIGSGTGKSTFPLAKYARRVIGIEPEDAMRDLAIQAAHEQNIKNVEFKKGFAEDIPLEDNSVDITVAVTAASLYNEENIKKYNSEAERITRKNGYIVSIDIPPGWYGGELNDVILGKNYKSAADDMGVIRDKTFTSLGFNHRDFYSFQDYKTVDKIVRTYGFIFGKNAIEYIREHRKTTIKWKIRIYYRKV